MKIYIGHDSRFSQATRACRKSIEDHSKEGEHEIKYLDKKSLTRVGAYGRKEVSGESTEFSFTRFYIPLIMNYSGYALFCDNDFLWRVDPREVSRYIANQPISVVKHKAYVAKSNKMDGIVNILRKGKNLFFKIIYNPYYKI